MTSRLLRLAQVNWAKIDGMMASQGLDPLELPADRMMNLIYWWATKDAYDQQELNRFERQLWRPPLGARAPAGSPWSSEAETAAFQAFAAETTGSVPVNR